jgi:hypothetical protein
MFIAIFGIDSITGMSLIGGLIGISLVNQMASKPKQ